MLWTFAEMLQALSKTAYAMPADDCMHRQAMREAAKALYLSLGDETSWLQSSSDPWSKKTDQLSPEDEVLLLHVLE